ncbi:MAG: FixH family protein [Bacteroidales bacterium]|nr:FixH family protein [Bacteroidales bacterium]
MKIQWNWPTKLVVAMAAFMLMIISLVVFMFQQDISLVEKDYYPRGQAYQEMIDMVQNTVPYANDIIAKVEINEVHIAFPAFFRPEKVEGQVHFYSRINDANDRFANLNLNEDGVFIYPVDGFKGRFILKISWQQDGIDYYTEKDISIE